MNLTPRQLDTLVVIRRYRHDNGISPTMREVADAMGCSKITAWESVAALRRKGAIQYLPRVARSIRIVGETTGDAAFGATVREAAATLRLAGHAAVADRLERLHAATATDVRPRRARVPRQRKKAA